MRDDVGVIADGPATDGKGAVIGPPDSLASSGFKAPLLQVAAYAEEGVSGGC